MWFNKERQVIYHFHHEIRLAFPDVSMPDIISDIVISSLGLVEIYPTDRPAGYVVEEDLPEFINDRWEQRWKIRPPTEFETIIKSTEIRADRNRRLLECDWTQVNDAPVDKLSWAVYRQHLRDITTQQEFPWDVTWPTPPSN